MANNKCPCCGQVQAFVGVQEQHPRSKRKAVTLVECSAYGCELYLRTGTAEGLADWWQAQQEKRRAKD